jgi:hypothetical protein
VNKVVVRYSDGRIIKGVTSDFFPNKDMFHVSEENSSGEDIPVEVNIQELKALFFVKDFKGNPQHVEGNEFDPDHPPAGRRIKVVFNDGETLIGTTTGYQPGRPGFFVVPADTKSNIERCFVVTAATQDVGFL